MTQANGGTAVSERNGMGQECGKTGFLGFTARHHRSPWTTESLSARSRDVDSSARTGEGREKEGRRKKKQRAYSWSLRNASNARARSTQSCLPARRHSSSRGAAFTWLPVTLASPPSPAVVRCCSVWCRAYETRSPRFRPRFFFRAQARSVSRSVAPSCTLLLFPTSRCE